MNLRTVTVGLSYALLIGILMSLIGSWIYYNSVVCQVHHWEPLDINRASLVILLRLIICGFPLIVLMILSSLSKKNILQVILFVVVLLYGGWCAFAMCIEFCDFVNPRINDYALVAIPAFLILLPILIAVPIVEKMIFRDVTIYVAGIVLGITIFLTIAVVHSGVSFHNGVVLGAWYVLFAWLLTGSPPAVSFLIVKNMKGAFPLLIILFATITYCIFYMWGLMYMDSEFGVLMLIVANFYSLFIMFPAWITAIILNRRYVKQATSLTEQTQSLLKL